MKYALATVLATLASGFITPAHAASHAGSEGMSLMLMCQTYTQVSGNLGLFLGFLIAIGGLYALVAKGAYKMGIITIIFGALLTTLPGLIISTLKGANVWLRQAGVTQQEIDLGVTLDSIVSYAGNCDQIIVDLAQYAKYESMDGSFNPNGAIRSAGMNSNGAALDSDNIPEQNNSMANVPQLGCLGQVLDIEQYPGAVITSGWGMRIHPIHKTRKYHAGLDIAAATGTRALAFQGGVVDFSGWQNGYGNIINVNHGSFNTQYAHLSQRSKRVGDRVAAGDVIGLVGNTGAGTGPHLHFEYRRGGKGTEIDPMGVLGCGG